MFKKTDQTFDFCETVRGLRNESQQHTATYNLHTTFNNGSISNRSKDFLAGPQFTRQWASPMQPVQGWRMAAVARAEIDCKGT